MDDLDEFLSPENRKIHEEQLRIASKRKPADKRAKHAANAVAVSVDYTKTDADTDRELARLAKLSIVDYEHERTEAAAKLDVRAPILDKLVTAKRPKEEATGQGRPLEFEEPEPWDASVNGAELLDEIETVFARFVVCEKADRTALVLWCCATWFEPVAQVAPILNVVSPVLRCGKTTTLTLIARLVKRPLASSNVSSSAVFRTIEKYIPTLLLDEADSYLASNEELRGLLNSGHTREAAFTMRTVGDDHEPKQFSTWAFKALAGIGKRAATIEDRAITISLKRKLPGEKVERLRHAAPGLFQALVRKLSRFAADNMGTVAAAKPELPAALNDRAQDNWELLFAVAHAAGGRWPGQAEQAALAAAGIEEDLDQRTLLLADIRDAFGEKDRISSDDLVAYLVGLEERPWSESNHGKALSKNQLARRLKPFGLKPKNIRDDGRVPKGYTLDDFNKNCARYLPPPFQTATAATSHDFNGLREKKTATSQNPVAVEKSSKSANINAVAIVAVQNPPKGQRAHVADENDGWEGEI